MTVSAANSVDVLQCANIYGRLQALAWDMRRNIYLPCQVTSSKYNFSV